MGCILQAKRHHCVTERTPWSAKGSEMLIISFDGDGVESIESVQRRIIFESSQSIEYLRIEQIRFNQFPDTIFPIADLGCIGNDTYLLVPF